MNMPEKLVRFFRYLCLGVVVMVLVLVSAAAMKRLGISGESLADLEAPAQDLLIGFVRPRGPNFPPILFIDVDEATWRDPAWGGGEPRAVPLAPLAGLMNQAIRQGATYIFLDFAVDGGPDEEMDAFYHQLRETVENAPDRHFLFVRSVREPLEGDGPPTIRPSHALDRLMADFPDRVHAVSTNFTETEHTERHWRLWESAAFRVPGRVGEAARDYRAVLPSPQLLIHALEIDRVRAGRKAGEAPPASAPPVRRSLALLEKTGKTPPVLWTPERLLAWNAGTRSAAEPDPADEACGRTRSDFAIGRWIQDVFGRCYLQDDFTETDCRAAAPDCERQATDAPRHYQANRVFFYWSDGGKPSRKLYRVSARDLMSAEPADRAGRLNGFREDAKTGNGIAIVGASYEASRDFHNTPRGEMPGALLVANALATMALHGPMQALGFHLNAVMLLGMVILFSAAFAWAADSVRARALAAALVILLYLLVTGVLLIWAKTWFNFTLTISFFWILLKLRERKLWLITAGLAIILLLIR